MIKFLLGALAVFAASICSADPDLSTMAIVRDADIKWTESPRAPGLSMAVVYGDPAMPGLYIIRVQLCRWRDVSSAFSSRGTLYCSSKGHVVGRGGSKVG